MSDKLWNGATADWNIAADWSPAGVPGSLDTAVLDGTLGYVVSIGSAVGYVAVPESEMVTNATLADAAATLRLNNYGTLGVTNVLDLAAGTIDLIGMLTGGTIAENGGTIFGDRGTLNGVSVIGPLNLATVAGQVLYIENGLTLLGAGGVGPGSLSVSSALDQLSFGGSQTLANATVSLAGAADRVSLQTLTLAATTTLIVSGYNTRLYGAELSAASSLTNAGAIIVGGPTGGLDVSTTRFTNDGLITVGSGDALGVGEIDGSGSVALAAGSTLLVGMGGSTLTTAALLAEIGSLVGTQAGVHIELGGLIDNDGVTLDLTSGALAGATLAADIVGGTVLGDSGAMFVGGTLDGVVYQGQLSLGGTLTTLSIADGATLQSAPGIAGTIVMTGLDDTILLVNTPTLDRVTVDISGQGDSIIDTSDSGLTLGTAFISNISGGGYFGTPGTLVNYGTIADIAPDAGFQFASDTIYNFGLVLAGADVAAPADTGRPAAFEGGTVNTGEFRGPAHGFFVAFTAGLAASSTVAPLDKLIYFSPGLPPVRSSDLARSSAADASTGVVFGAGAGLELGGVVQTDELPGLLAQIGGTPAGLVFGGSLDNSGATLDLTGSLDNVVIAGDVSGGVIEVEGGLAFARSSVLTDVTVVGTLDLSANPDASVVLSASTVASADAGPATILIDGTGDALTLFGGTVAQVLTDTRIELGIAAGATADVLGQVGGTVVLGTGVTLTAAGISSIYLNASNGYNSIPGDATLVNAGVITDSGLLTIGTFGGNGGTGTPEQATFVNTGLIAVGAGTATSGLTLGGTVVNAGTVAVTGAETVQVLGTAFTNAGLISLGGGAILSFATATAGAGTIALLDGAETIAVGGGTPLVATLEDFSAGDKIDFLSVAPTGTLAPSVTLAAGVATIVQGGTEVAALTLTGHAYAQGDLALGSDRHGGTALTTDVPCFVTGTRLRGRSGEIAVEHLAIGDELRTASGGWAPVVWIGRRRVACDRHPRPDLVWPVRIAAGAFADGMPGRDLLLSPDHAVLAGDVLIPVKHLINGRSIAQIESSGVEYWHVELARHDILLAEGLPAESYLDTGNRGVFANGADHLRLHPDFARRGWEHGCAALVQDGPRLVAVKQHLFARAGIVEGAPTPALSLRAGGRDLRPDISADGEWRVVLPPGTRRLDLVSPAWIPAACMAASLDRRRLGVRLFGLTIDGAPVELGSEVLASGFHPLETTAEGACRWTDGSGTLALPGAGAIRLRVGDGAETPVDAVRESRRRRSRRR